MKMMVMQMMEGRRKEQGKRVRLTAVGAFPSRKDYGTYYVAKVKPSNFCSTVLILGSGKGFLSILLFSSLKLVSDHTVRFFFTCINVSAANSDDGCHSSTPNSQRRLISFMIVSLWKCGIGNILPR